MRSPKLILSALMTLALSPLAQAELVTNIPEVGPHYRIFIMEKNENRENTTAIYTKLNKNCEIVRNQQGTPTFFYYWLMNGREYKKLAQMWIDGGMGIKGIKDRLMIESDPRQNSKNSFVVDFTDLSEVKHDLRDPGITVTSARNADGSCDVSATMELGAQDQYAKIKVTGVYAEGKKVFSWPPVKMVAVTIYGIDQATGEKRERKYLAK